MGGTLRLRLLGPVQAERDGEPLRGFESRKALALPCYLALHDAPLTRAHLADLFWPDKPETRGRGNLSRVLHNLSSLFPDCLHADRHTIQFRRSPSCWLDVEAFDELIAKGDAESLAATVELYRGDLMAGYYLDDCPDFETWLVVERERWHRRAVEVLENLIEGDTRRGEFEQLRYARRLLELDPWREEAHQKVMTLLARTGQRSAALAQYRTCCQVLAEELGIEPGLETRMLYERIRDGKSGRGEEEQKSTGEVFSSAHLPLRTTVPPAPPAFLTSVSPPALSQRDTARSTAEGPPSPPAPFVARECELAKLDNFLDMALAGQGRVIFVTGDAGSGKTALIREFARRALEMHGDLIVASGNCNAHTGIGDPYLPFREILALLTGDIETRWLAGGMSRTSAQRLWGTVPHAVKALVDVGPDLVDIFVSGPPLVTRATAAAPGGRGTLAQLKTLVACHQTAPAPAHLRQSDLFAQYTRVLHMLARQQPLLLIIDDLEWADAGSISLLFHLGRQLEGQRILVVGLYRPADIALGRPSTSSGEWERHPLEPVVNELQRQFGNTQVVLRQAGGKPFVEALLDTEPNRLGIGFREALHRQTGGHPLFTIEMLRGLQARGDLVQDEQGHWIEGPVLDWQTLPARVEGVINERISRLPLTLQEVLKVASVEGEVFTAEVVARVQEINERQIVSQLSHVLDRQQRLVRVQGSQQSETKQLSRYRFRHILFQKFIYDSLDQVERVYLHQAVGNELEQLYESRTEEVAIELARHFQAAGLVEKAVGYLRQAGERAKRLSAHEEAIAHFTKALALLVTLPDTPEHALQEVRLQLDLGNAWIAVKGFAAPEAGQAYSRARALCRQVGETPQLYPVLQGLQRYYLIRGELQTARELGEEFLHLAQHQRNLAARLAALAALGPTLYYLGELTAAQEQLEQGVALYDLRQHRSLAFDYGMDPGVTCLFHEALALWHLGYPEQALARSHQVLSLAQDLSHPFTLACALYHLALLHQLRREEQPALEQAQATIIFSTEHNFPVWQATAMIVQGWVLVEQGEMKEGITRIRQGLDACRNLGTATGGAPGETQYLSVLAEAYSKAGLPHEGLEGLAVALAAVNRGGERMWEAELYRLKGELLLKDEVEGPVLPVLNEVEGSAVEGPVLPVLNEVEGSAVEGMKDESPENCFLRAIEIARRQQAKSLELRAVTSLSRLWNEQGKQAEARRMLAEIYDWFAEGFDTPDLKEAKALLDSLS